jgi:hypothetical protein
MAIEYAKSALAESIIPVKDIPLKVTSAVNVTPVTYVSAPIGNLVRLEAGFVDEVVVAATGLVTSATNLGISEGMNFEGLGVTPKVGKVRISGNAIYKAPFGLITVASGADQKKFVPATPTQAIVGTTRAIGLNSVANTGIGYGGQPAQGFVVHSDDAAANKVAKIIEIDAQEKVVYFQLVSSSLVTS